MSAAQEGRSEGVWSWVGKAAAVLGCLWLVIQIWHGIFSDKVTLRLNCIVNYHPTATLLDNKWSALNVGESSIRIGLKGFLKSQYNIDEQTISEEAVSNMRALLWTWLGSERIYRSTAFAHCVASNRGQITAADVVVTLPRTPGVVVIDKKHTKWSDFADAFLKIGDLRSGQSVELLMWFPEEVEGDDFRITHSKGKGDTYSALPNFGFPSYVASMVNELSGYPKLGSTVQFPEFGERVSAFIVLIVGLGALMFGSYFIIGIMKWLPRRSRRHESETIQQVQAKKSS